MPSTHFLLGQQICGHQNTACMLGGPQAYRDTSTRALLSHPLIEYSDPWLRKRETEAQRDRKGHPVAMAAPRFFPQPMFLCSLLSRGKAAELQILSMCRVWFPHFSEQPAKTDPTPPSPQDAYFNDPFLYPVFSLHCGSCSQNIRRNQPRNISAVLEPPKPLDT